MSVKLELGMFYADPDTPIARRIQQEFKNFDQELKLCDFYQAGLPKMEVIEQFLSNKDGIFWLATKTSLNDKAIMKSTQDIGLHEGIVHKSFRFIVFQPKEYLDCTLKAVLRAYTPLCEDQFFKERLKSTLKSLNKRALKENGAEQSSSTSGISTATDNPIAPVAEVTKNDSETDQRELNMVITESGDKEPSAEPIHHPTVENIAAGDPPQTVYNITIEGSNNRIQIGAHNQVINEGAVEQGAQQ